MSDLGVGGGVAAAAAGHVTKEEAEMLSHKRLDEGDLVNQTNGKDLRVPAALLAMNSTT